MSTSEMKKRIQERVNFLDEAQLKFVMDIIEKASQDQETSTIDIKLLFEEAVERYGNVLQKLAQ